jgi:hypothetical protein
MAHLGTSSGAVIYTYSTFKGRENIFVLLSTKVNLEYNKHFISGF